MSTFFANQRNRDRPLLGFAAICLVPAGAVGTTIWKALGSDALTQRMIELRVPTAMAGGDMVSQVHASQAAQRVAVAPDRRSSPFGVRLAG